MATSNIMCRGTDNPDTTCLDDAVFHFIYGCALRDAILQKSFQGKRDWIIDVKDAQKPVRDYIDRILSGKYAKDDCEVEKEHNKDFLETARQVCLAINKERENMLTKFKEADRPGKFHFGNAQKLINMTAKHIYAHTYSINATSKESIRNYFRYCHCPMDSIMLSKVWAEYKTRFDSQQRKKELEPSKDDRFIKAWGNEDFDNNEFPKRYLNYQTAIKKLIKKDGRNIYPIEYDYVNWNYQ